MPANRVDALAKVQNVRGRDTLKLLVGGAPKQLREVLEMRSNALGIFTESQSN